MNYIEPIFSGIEGYYNIPGFSRYAISKLGSLINKETGEELTGYPNVHGYHKFNLISDEGVNKEKSRHRLLLLVFKNEGVDYSEMHVNHINHTPGDDRLENLEWVTPKENSQHAARHGRSPKPIKVQTRCLNTGKVKAYRSMTECGRVNNLNRDAIIRRIKLGPTRVYGTKQYRVYSEKPWPKIGNVEQALLINGREESVQCHNLITGTTKTFESVTDMSTYLGVAVSTVSVWLSDKTMSVHQGGWLVKYTRDCRSWRDDITSFDEMLVEYNRTSKRKVVQVTNERTGLITYYWTAAQAARVNNLKVTALDYRLKSRGQTIFSDNCRYGYYPY